MKKTYSPQRKHLITTLHSKKRLSERGLWSVLDDIATIAYSPTVPRFADRSDSGRAVDRIEIDGICLILSQELGHRPLTLISLYSAGNEVGPPACARIRLIAKNCTKSASLKKKGYGLVLGQVCNKPVRLEFNPRSAVGVNTCSPTLADPPQAH